MDVNPKRVKTSTMVNENTEKTKKQCFSSSTAKESEKYVERPSEITSLRFQIHHGGVFVYHPTKVYVNGVMEEMNWDWDVDHMSYMEISKLVKNIGYRSFQCLWYRAPKLSLARGLKPLQNDEDVLHMVEDAKGHNVVELYVDHLIEATIEDELEDGGEGSELDSEDDEEYVVKEGEDLEDSETEEASDGEDGDREGEEDNEEDSFIDGDYDEKWDWTSVLPPETIEEVRQRVKSNGISTNKNIVLFEGMQSTAAEFFGEDDYDSEVLETPPNSEDDEDQAPKFPYFKLPINGEPLKFKLGLKFSSKEHVHDAVKEYAMTRKKNLRIKPNDAKRMVVKCVEGCSFHMWVSKRSGQNYWQLVSLTDEHNCHRTPKNRQAKTEWLAKKFVPTLRHTPHMKTSGIKAEALQRWGVKLSDHQAYRAKRRAIEIIQGAGADQYSSLRSYAEELRRSNPNSTVIIKCSESARGPVFERIYVCLEACKAAFAYTCRPLIGLDACFLKGEFGGQLMTAVGKDGNNMMIPIAYAVVEAETKDSWQWFVELLLNDLRELNQREYTFISDQQKVNSN